MYYFFFPLHYKKWEIYFNDLQSEVEKFYVIHLLLQIADNIPLENISFFWSKQPEPWWLQKISVQKWCSENSMNDTHSLKQSMSSFVYLVFVVLSDTPGN